MSTDKYMAIEEILGWAGGTVIETDCVASSSQGEVLHFLKTLAVSAGPSITFLLVMPTWPHVISAFMILCCYV